MESQKKTVSFKKADYSHTLVASFTCNTNIADLTLRVRVFTVQMFCVSVCYKCVCIIHFMSNGVVLQVSLDCVCVCYKFCV